MKKQITLVLVLISTIVQAQQLPTFSQYMLNPYIINPAAAGIQNDTRFFLHYRNQWMGFSNSPKTFAITFETPLNDNKVGLGFQFQNDQSHILVNNAGKLSYRYTLDLNSEHRLGFGLYGGFMQRRINYSAIENADLEDPSLFTQDLTGSVFDAGFGTWYTWKTLEAGFSIDQMLNNKFEFTDDITGNNTSFQSIRHFTLNAAYTYQFKNEDWAIKPALVARSFQGANVNFEATAIGKWKNMLWAGAGYRQNFGLIFLAGIEVAEQLTFGYSYDYSLNDIKYYNAGSHEVLLSYKFGKGGQAGSDPETTRRLRKQANDIRDLKADNEDLRAQLNNQKEEIDRLKGVEQRDEAEMKKVIDENKVDKIPTEKGTKTAEEVRQSQAAGGTTSGTSTASSASNSEEVQQLKNEMAELQKEIEGLKNSQDELKANSEIESKLSQLEHEIEVLKSGSVITSPDDTDPKIDKFYVVAGAYFRIDDAKLLQKILKREMNMDTRVVSRSDRRFFFVVTKEVKTNTEAQDEMKRLKVLGIKKYINGNLWIYGTRPE